MVYKDIEGNLIGRGEDSAIKILERIFPGVEIKSQVKLKKIVEELCFPVPKLSERQEKESIDIYMTLVNETKIRRFAIRVQNGINKKGKIRGHTGEGLARADSHQKDLLEDAGVIVVDLNEYECPELFKERVNSKSFWEVCNALIQVKPIV